MWDLDTIKAMNANPRGHSKLLESPVRVVRIAIGYHAAPVIIVATHELNEINRSTPEMEHVFSEDAKMLYDVLYNTIPWKTFEALRTLLNTGKPPKEG